MNVIICEERMHEKMDFEKVSQLHWRTRYISQANTTYPTVNPVISIMGI